MANLAFLSATELSALIETGDVDPRDLTRVFLAGRGGEGRGLNCFITLCKESRTCGGVGAAEGHFEESVGPARRHSGGGERQHGCRRRSDEQWLRRCALSHPGPKIQKWFAACARPGRSSSASSTCTRARLGRQMTILISDARRIHIATGTRPAARVADPGLPSLRAYAARRSARIPAALCEFLHLIAGLSD